MAPLRHPPRRRSEHLTNGDRKEVTERNRKSEPVTSQYATWRTRTAKPRLYYIAELSPLDGFGGGDGDPGEPGRGQPGADDVGRDQRPVRRVPEQDGIGFGQGQQRGHRGGAGCEGVLLAERGVWAYYALVPAAMDALSAVLSTTR